MRAEAEKFIDAMLDEHIDTPVIHLRGGGGGGVQYEWCKLSENGSEEEAEKLIDAMLEEQV